MMIISRRTTKNCNICYQEVAVLEGVRFRTVRGFVTLRGDLEYLFGKTVRDDVHICNGCWEKMQEVVRKNLKPKEDE